MTETIPQAFRFDPGYAQHTTILSLSLEYIYSTINQYKNFGQRKTQFKRLYPKILNTVDNNTGFCLGCLLWASYIKSQGEDIKIEGNPCLGDTFNEAEAVEEIDFSIQYFDQLKKDAKYYLGTDYEINPQHIKIFEIYKKFLVLNEAFVNTKTTTDIKLPSEIKIPTSQDELDKIYTKIQEVIKTGKLLDLAEVFDLIQEG